MSSYRQSVSDLSFREWIAAFLSLATVPDRSLVFFSLCQWYTRVGEKRV